MNIWKGTKVYKAFLFMGHAFWKENVEEGVKLLKSSVLNCCVKVTTADLRKVGLKIREWRFRELAPKFHSEVEAMSLTPLPPSPKESAPLAHFFALQAMNGPLPAELKFREITTDLILFLH